jgi:hypothetical protein
MDLLRPEFISRKLSGFTGSRRALVDYLSSGMLSSIAAQALTSPSFPSQSYYYKKHRQFPWKLSLSEKCESLNDYEKGQPWAGWFGMPRHPTEG